VLTRIAAMPVTEWSYKAQDAAIRHIGPTAQDFHAAFGLGEDPLRIGTLDADGVALAGVKALEARDGAEVRGRTVAVRRSEVRAVEHVEGFEAQFEPALRQRQRERLVQPHVECEDRGTSGGVARRVAERLRHIGRNRDRRRVQVAVHRPLRLVNVDVAADVRAVGRRAADRLCGRRRVAQVHRQPAPHRVDGAHAPAAGQQFERGRHVRGPAAVATERQLPDERRGVVQRLVVARGAELAIEVGELTRLLSPLAVSR
jgi:hypothetical protein